MDWTESLASPGRGVALLVSALTTPGTFSRSLSARSWKDQGLITALATSTGYLLTIVSHDVLAVIGEAVSPALPLPDSLTQSEREELSILLTELAAIPIGLAVGRLLTRTPGEPIGRGMVRQAAWRLGVTGMGGGLLAAARIGTRLVDARFGGNRRLARLPVSVPIGLGAALLIERSRRKDIEPDLSADLTSANPVLGLAAAAGVVGILTGVSAGEGLAAHYTGNFLSARLPGSSRVWQLAIHGATAATMAIVVSQFWSRTMHKIESGTTAYEPMLTDEAAGRWTTPLMSGDPASLVEWKTIGREGRRHAVSSVRTSTMEDQPYTLLNMDFSIPTVMGQPAVAAPIQVYVGLDSAPTGQERVDLALAELDRTDAWSRSLIMLVSPTGTGYVNYCAIAAVQYMTLGDVATVTLQYSKRPSPLSLGKVGQAREQNRLLWLTIAERVRALPLDHRPRIVVFGESLGAHTSQDVFMHWGTLGPQSLGVERALWIGTPYLSKWKEQVTGAPRPDVNPDLVTVVNDHGQLKAMAPEQRAKLRYVLLSHDNDGVTKFGPDLLAVQPRWLGPDRPHVEDAPAASPRGIPASMRWRPLTTFFQSLVDMKNAQTPGKFRAFAHDYRPDLPHFLREVYALEVTDEQLASVAAAIEQREDIRQSLFK